MNATSSQDLSNKLRSLGILAAIQFAMLMLFVVWIPLPRMYSWSDSAEYQRIALFMLDKGDLTQGYARFFPPGEPFVVSMFYLLLGDINYASLVTNFLFGLGCLFAVKSMTQSTRLSLLFMFIPYWFILSFSTLGDASFIFLQLVAAWFAIKHRWLESVVVGSLSMLLRPEGLFLMVVIAALALKEKRFEKKFLIPPALAILVLLYWGFVAFNNPFAYFSVYATHRASVSVSGVLQPWAQDYAMGSVGKGKIAYVVAVLIVSIATLIRCFRRFGFFHFFFLETLAMTLAHTILSPEQIYPDMVKSYLYIAPFTLIAFKEVLLRRFIVALAFLVPLALFVAVVFWTITFSVPFL